MRRVTGYQREEVERGVREAGRGRTRIQSREEEVVITGQLLAKAGGDQQQLQEDDGRRHPLPTEPVRRAFDEATHGARILLLTRLAPQTNKACSRSSGRAYDGASAHFRQRMRSVVPMLQGNELSRSAAA